MTAKNRPETRDWLFAIMAMAGLAGLVLLYLVFAYEPTTDRESFWLGEGGVAGALLGAGTLAAASTAAWQAWRAHQLNAITEAATRYQKGSELLAASSPATQMSGAILLTELAMEHPQKYMISVIDTLNHYLAAIEDENTREVSVGRVEVCDPKEWPSSRHTSMTTFQKLSSLLAEAKNLGIVTEDTTIFLPSLFICSFYMKKSNFSVWEIKQLFLNRTALVDCDFRHSSIQVRVGERVAFERCNFSGAAIAFVNSSGRVYLERPEEVSFKDCVFGDATTFKGQSLEEWALTEAENLTEPREHPHEPQATT